MIKKIQQIFLCILVSIVSITGCSVKGEDNVSSVSLDQNNPTVISVWHYYNGMQQNAFEDLVEEFNNTFGKEKGIVVEAYAQGNVYDLASIVLDAANKKAGASEMPNAFAAYADTAYEINKIGLVADISDYLTQEEIAEYVKGYIEEGQLSESGELKIFPIAKATELMVLNQTDWEKFTNATEVNLEKMKTFEGIAEIAEQYYKWTDSLTIETNDGKAFFGRDAMANYFIIGAKQLGMDIITVENDKVKITFEEKIVRRIWDNYYDPYIKGYFTSNGKFRSGDMQTGDIIAYIGSSSGAAYYVDDVIVNDLESYPIEIGVYQSPIFEGGEAYAVQQGAGIVVTNTTKEEIYASVMFLKWFTQVDRNIEFSISSGYLPVTYSANDKVLITNAIDNNGVNDNIKNTLLTAIDVVNSHALYTTKVSKNSSDIRAVLENSLSKKAAADRDVILNNISGGMPVEEAIAQFDNDQNFKVWYENTKEALELLAN